MNIKLLIKIVIQLLVRKYTVVELIT